MSWQEVETLFARLDALTTADAKLAIYGPFNYGGAFTSASNAAFDASLKARAPHMGIRDVEAVDALARAAGFALIDDVRDAGQQPHAGLAAAGMSGTATPVVLAWSGGKDSTLALERLLADAHWRVVALVTTVTTGYDRIAIHGVRRSILHRQIELPRPSADRSRDSAGSGQRRVRNRIRRCAGARARALPAPMRDDRVRRPVPRRRPRVSRGDARPARLARDLSALGRRHDARSRTISSTRLSSDPGCVDTAQLDRVRSAAARSTPPCSPTCRRTSIRAARTASSTRASTRARLQRAIALERGERVLRDGRFQYVDLTEAADLELSKRS